MRILILSPYPDRISEAIHATGDTWSATAERIGPADCAGCDMLVSYGYRHILKADVLGRFGAKALNMHIAYLPYNRGAHPNFWAWADDTPHGVTVHVMDSGIDSGPVILRSRCYMNPDVHTFATSHAVLMRMADAVFREHWPRIRRGSITPYAVGGDMFDNGSFHKARDLPMDCLPKGWDTPVTEGRKLYRERATRRKTLAEQGQPG